MKKISGIIINSLAMMGVILMINSCKKDEPAGSVPVLTTTAVTSITQTTANCGGTITSDGGTAVIARGVCWSISQTPTTVNSKTIDGAGGGSFKSLLYGLIPNTTYYIRAYATNNTGTAYGITLSFKTTDSQIPVLYTSGVSNVSDVSATSGGLVIYEGISSVTSRGVCWKTIHNPTIQDNKTSDGVGSGIFTSNITGLIANTTYYIRSYAINNAGTGYGDEVVIKTNGNDTIVTDIDGFTYHLVTIGSQVWMKENLKTTKYCNGDPIPNITDDNQWGKLTTGAYSNYNNDTNNGNIYGHLYNWYAVVDGRNICPIGWHVPSENEWTSLIDYLGGYIIGGSLLKEKGTKHWQSPNTGATNESGFTALPSGFRGGSFSNIKNIGYWWSSTEKSSKFSYRLSLSYNKSTIDTLSPNKENGYAIRCLRD